MENKALVGIAAEFAQVADWVVDMVLQENEIDEWRKENFYAMENRCPYTVETVVAN